MVYPVSQTQEGKMAKYTDLATKTGDRVLSLIGDAQDAVVSAVSSVSSFVGSVIPELPQIPGTENVPAPRELVDDYFSFAEKALEQRDVAAVVEHHVIPVGTDTRDRFHRRARHEAVGSAADEQRGCGDIAERPEVSASPAQRADEAPRLLEESRRHIDLKCPPFR